MRSVTAYCLLFLLVLGGLFSSCSKTLDEGTVSLSKSRVSLSADAVFVSVTSSASWSLSVQYEGEQKDWITLSKTSGTGSTNSIILSYTRNDADDPREAVITAHFVRTSVSVRFVQTGKSAVIVGGEGTVLPQWPDYPGLASDVVRGWMELPEVTAEEACAWVYHDMSVGDSQVRNYSLYYDARNMLARWVAYPLNSGLIGSGNRTDDWDQVDPKIPSGMQPYTAQGWGKGGYDRGHQIPSGDRLRREANEATFYPTNMTVQDSDLNQGLWMNLESKLRVWMASFDTLYVVTGCVPSGSSFITDRGGNKVNVPQAYFKALLGYNLPTAASPEKYSGIAFYLDNDDPGTAAVTRDMAMTISDLEHLLGINFFVNLPQEYVPVAEESISSTWKF